MMTGAAALNPDGPLMPGESVGSLRDCTVADMVMAGGRNTAECASFLPGSLRKKTSFLFDMSALMWICATAAEGRLLPERGFDNEPLRRSAFEVVLRWPACGGDIACSADKPPMAGRVKVLAGNFDSD